MKPPASASKDDISTKAIKMAKAGIAPLLLQLVNSVILTGQYPTILKTTKIIPIKKPNKDDNSANGWRPINLVSAVSKVIEKNLLKQILHHLKTNNLIPYLHHGSIGGKSIQTLITDLHDCLLEDLENDTETALLVLDQSKAYDLVSHEILVRKAKVLGFNTKAAETLSNYLAERKQLVEVQGFQSQELLTGPYSVTQGSTLSCALYLIHILDLPMIFHDTLHTPQQQRNCHKENLKTFVE